MTAMSGWSGLARRNARRTFRDRREAGRVLAEELAAYRGQDDLSGARPGAWRRAGRVGGRAALQAPLDVFLVRKLGVPQWQELAMGALATGGGVVVNDSLVRSLGISDEQLRPRSTARPRSCTAASSAYRGGRPPVDIAGKR